MQKSKIVKRISLITVALVIIWIGIGITDYVRVISEKKPLFCFEASCGVYLGLGYRFETYPHPITEKIEYAYYIFGIQVDNNFTNSIGYIQ